MDELCHKLIYLYKNNNINKFNNNDIKVLLHTWGINKEKE